MKVKVYKLTDSGGVVVDGQPLRLRRLSNEPSNYKNPDRIGFSILVDCVGDSAALLHAPKFQRDIVDNCDPGQEISSDEVREWNDFICQIGASVQSVIWTRHGAEPQPVSGTPLRFPRLFRVQKKVSPKPVKSALKPPL